MRAVVLRRPDGTSARLVVCRSRGVSTEGPRLVSRIVSVRVGPEAVGTQAKRARGKIALANRGGRGQIGILRSPIFPGPAGMQPASQAGLLCLGLRDSKGLRGEVAAGGKPDASASARPHICACVTEGGPSLSPCPGSRGHLIPHWKHWRLGRDACRIAHADAGSIRLRASLAA